MLRRKRLLNALLRPVLVPEHGSEPLVNTVHLGIHLFNPHRFNGVLHHLDKIRDTPHGTDLTEKVAAYFRAGEKCFQNPDNVRMVPIESIVSSLVILRRDFATMPIYETIVKSLIDSLDSESRVVELVKSIELAGFSDESLTAQLEAKLELVETLNNRVRVSHFADDPVAFLQPVLSMSGDRLLRASLSEVDFATVVKICDLTDEKAERFIDCIEVVMKYRLESAATNVDKLKLLHLAITVARTGGAQVAQRLEPLIFHSLKDQLDLLSVSQSIDILDEFSSRVSSQVWNNMSWRLGHDPKYLDNLDSSRIARLVRFAAQLDQSDRQLLMPNLFVSFSNRSNFQSVGELVSLIESFNTLTGNPWIEYPKFVDFIVSRAIALLEHNVLVPQEIEPLLASLIKGLKISSPSIVAPLLDCARFTNPDHKKLVEEYIQNFCERNEGSRSRTGHVILAKLLRSESQSLNKLLKTVKETGTIPLHTRLSEYSLPQLEEVVDAAMEVDGDHTLTNLEMINDAALIGTKGTVQQQLSLLRCLASHKFPSPGLVARVSVDAARLSSAELSEFMSICGSTRCRPNFDAGVLLKHEAAHTKFVGGLVKSAALLGMLTDNKTVPSKLVALVGFNGGSDLLAALLVGRVIPSERELSGFAASIMSHPESVSDTERMIFTEMSSEIEELQNLSTAVPVSVSQEARQPDEWIDVLPQRLSPGDIWQPCVMVGKTEASTVDVLVNGTKAILVARPEDFLSSHPGELTEEFKWRHMIVAKHVAEIEIVRWIDLLS